MAAGCANLGELAMGVVRPFPGQEQVFCGIGSCAAFRDALRNSMTPIRYSKVAFVASASAASGITLAVATPTAFADWIGTEDGGSTGLPYDLTVADTNYYEFERPVPDTSDFLFCAVGLAVNIERPFIMSTDSKAFPAYISEAADYRETLREELFNNVTMQWKVGNNGCMYDIARLCDYPSPNAPHGGDVLAPGVISRELGFTPFNAVLCIDSVKNQKRATIDLTLSHAIVVSQTSVSLPSSPDTLYVPVTLELFGFVCQLPGARDFVMGPSQPARQIAAPQGWR